MIIQRFIERATCGKRVFSWSFGFDFSPESEIHPECYQNTDNNFDIEYEV